MAKRKTATVSSAGKGVVVVTPPSASAPVRRRRSSGAITRRSKGTRRRRSSGSSEGSYKNKLMGVGMGGLAYGYLEKSFPQIPTIPFLGKSGTVAVACYFFGAKHPLIKDVGIAAAAIAGYSLGKEGKVSGEGWDED